MRKGVGVFDEGPAVRLTWSPVHGDSQPADIKLTVSRASRKLQRRVWAGNIQTI